MCLSSEFLSSPFIFIFTLLAWAQLPEDISTISGRGRRERWKVKTKSGSSFSFYFICRNLCLPLPTIPNTHARTHPPPHLQQEVFAVNFPGFCVSIPKRFVCFLFVSLYGISNIAKPPCLLSSHPIQIASLFQIDPLAGQPQFYCPD